MAKARENKTRKPKQTGSHPAAVSDTPEACPDTQLLDSLNKAVPAEEADVRINKQLPRTTPTTRATRSTTTKNINNHNINNGDDPLFRSEQPRSTTKKFLEIQVTPTPARHQGNSPCLVSIPPTAPEDPLDTPVMFSSPPHNEPSPSPVPVSRRHSGKSTGNRVMKPSQKKAGSGKGLSKLSWKFTEGTMGDKVSVPPPSGFVGEFGEQLLQKDQAILQVDMSEQAPPMAPIPAAMHNALPSDRTVDSAVKGFPQRFTQRVGSAWKRVRNATSSSNLQAQLSRSASPVKNASHLQPAAEVPTVPEVQVELEKAAKGGREKLPEKKPRDLPEPPQKHQVVKAKSHGSLFSKKQHIESETTKEKLQKEIQELEDKIRERQRKLQELAVEEASWSQPSMGDDFPVIPPPAGTRNTRGNRSRQLARPSMPTIMSGQRLDQIDPEDSNNRRRSASQISEEPSLPPHRDLRRTTARLPRQSDSRKRKAVETIDLDNKEAYERAYAEYDRLDDADYVEEAATSDAGTQSELATPIRCQPVRTAKASKAVSVTPGARGYENVPPVPRLEVRTTRASTRKKPVEKPISEGEDEPENDEGWGACF